MRVAAKGEMHCGTGPWCADLPLAATLQLAENSHQGFERKNAALHLVQWVCKSTTELGIERGLLENCVGSRIQTWNRYAYVINNPVSYIDPWGLYQGAPGSGGCTIDGCGGGSPADWCPGCLSFGWGGIQQGLNSYLGGIPGYSVQNGELYAAYAINGTPYWTSPDDMYHYPVDTVLVDLGSIDLGSSANNGFTFQLGVSVNWNFWGPLAGSGFAGIAIDSHGHVATYWGGGGGMAGGAGFSGGIQLAGSNGNSVCALGGPFTNVSGTAGYELAGTGDYFQGAGAGPGGVVQGGGVTLGIGGGGAASVQVTGTSVHPFGHSCVNGTIK